MNSLTTRDEGCRPELAVPASTDTNGDSMWTDWWLPFLAAVCAGLLMPLAVRTRSFGHDDGLRGVQKAHDDTRLG